MSAGTATRSVPLAVGAGELSCPRRGQAQATFVEFAFVGNANSTKLTNGRPLPSRPVRLTQLTSVIDQTSE